MALATPGWRLVIQALFLLASASSTAPVIQQAVLPLVVVITADKANAEQSQLAGILSRTKLEEAAKRIGAELMVFDRSGAAVIIGDPFDLGGRRARISLARRLNVKDSFRMDELSKAEREEITRQLIETENVPLGGVFGDAGSNLHFFAEPHLAVTLMEREKRVDTLIDLRPADDRKRQDLQRGALSAAVPSLAPLRTDSPEFEQAQSYRRDPSRVSFQFTPGAASITDRAKLMTEVANWVGAQSAMMMEEWKNLEGEFFKDLPDWSHCRGESLSSAPGAFQQLVAGSLSRRGSASLPEPGALDVRFIERRIQLSVSWRRPDGLPTGMSFSLMP